MSEAKIIRKGDAGLIHAGGDVFAFQIGASTSDNWLDQLSSTTSTSSINAQPGWETDPVIVAGKELVPYGTNNQLPTEIRKLMDENNLAPGILEREIGLLWGIGPQLYEEIWEIGKLMRKYGDDPEIRSFLNDFDLLKYLSMATTEYKYLKAHFTKFKRNKGARIGYKSKITELECIPAVDSRLGWVPSRRLEDVNNIYTGDFENECMKTGIKTFPVFNIRDPFAHAVSMAYYNSYSFARNFYPVPQYYGTLNWIKRSSDVPQLLKYLTDNALNVGYMVYSPAQYWEDRKQKLESQYADKDIKFINSKIEELKDTVFQNLANVMSGKKNVGKFFESVVFYDDRGNECKWTVEPVDHKTKDFIESQLKISDKADSSTTSGMGLDPALSNIIMDGKLSSGSEKLYALKLYLATDIAIPEAIIMQGINHAIQANFPGTKYKLGFYHEIVKKEEEVTPAKRTTNSI